jgi:cytochrome c biogenesis protein CcdA
MQTLIYGSSLVAAFLGGILALFAPCCIVSLLPAYLAAVLRAPRWRLIELTGIFALGVALVLFPVVLGIGALGQALGSAHREVNFLGGLLMLGLAVSTLAGKGWALPMPMLHRPAGAQSGAAGTLVLGIFSGIASSCCAPVLGGVLLLSATAGSLTHALALGTAYVLGMVAPLFLAAQLWDRFHLGDRSLFQGRAVTVRLGGRSFRRRLTDLGAGAIFLAMGGVMVGLALTGRATYTPGFLFSLNHWGSDRMAALAAGLRSLPDGVTGVALIALAVGLIVLAWPRERRVIVDQSSRHNSHVPPTLPPGGSQEQGTNSAVTQTDTPAASVPRHPQKA